MKSIFLGLHSTVHTSQLALALLIDRTTLDLQHPRCVSGGDIMNVDPNSVTAGVLSDLIKSSFESVTKGAGTYFGNSYRKIFEDFDPYMRETYRRIRKVRIL
ncbi:MAG: hypothetical protein KDK08_26515, partial [Rhizobiaceae bacterium]|nr:hypothetical protein [Rhizobiaceae bacterium]